MKTSYVNRKIIGPGVLLLGLLACNPGSGGNDPFFPLPGNRSDCDEAAVMSPGGDGQIPHPVLPVGATDIEPIEDVDQDNGPVSVLYPGLDTSTDGFYPFLPCDPSIGGDQPPQDTPPTQDEMNADNYLENFEGTDGKNIAKGLALNMPGPVAGVPDIGANTGCFLVTEKGKPPIAVECDDNRFLQSDQPFEGRDIIFVHGLALGHLKNWMGNYSPAHKLWPADSSEYLDAGKYFRTYAEEYWDLHIRENLFDPLDMTNTQAGYQWKPSDSGPLYSPKSNRYMLVAWSSNQTLEYAQHAFLTQVALAITQNKNVVTPPNSPMSPGYTGPNAMVRPFCSNGCVVISHSTGGLVVPSALSLAAAPNNHWGNNGAKIAGKIRLHVALEGAMSGSRLATVGMAVGLAAATVSAQANLLCQILDDAFGWAGTCGMNTGFVVNSILRDLMPPVAQGVWGQYVGSSPVPTVTAAGGSPTGNYALGLTKPILPGYDDGVVTMNSACGNPNLVLPGVLAPSGVTVNSLIKSFDMGIVFVRAAKLWASARYNFKAIPPNAFYLAGACTPYLSPTGMVLPVFSTMGGAYDSHARYGNFYSFLQSVADHSYDPGDSANPWSSSPTWNPSYPVFNPGTGQSASLPRHYKTFLGASNREESSAVTSAGAYQQFADGTYLVHPSFGAVPHEIVRGRKISFKLFGHRYTWWIWKRTYHLLDKWPDKQNSHYIYEYVGKR